MYLSLASECAKRRTMYRGKLVKLSRTFRFKGLPPYKVGLEHLNFPPKRWYTYLLVWPGKKYAEYHLTDICAKRSLAEGSYRLRCKRAQKDLAGRRYPGVLMRCKYCNEKKSLFHMKGSRICPECHEKEAMLPLNQRYLRSDAKASRKTRKETVVKPAQGSLF